DQHDLAPELFRVRFATHGRAIPALLHVLERWSYRTAQVVVTSNESQRQTAIERGRCRPEDVVVVRNGPDLDVFRPVPPEPALKRGRAYLLTCAGVMGVQDGIEYALRALHVLVHQRNRRDITLALLGDGDQRRSLATLSRFLGLDDHVHFGGWVA